MLKNLKLRSKILLAVCMVVALVFTLGMGILLQRFHGYAESEAYKLAGEMAGKYSYAV